MTENTVDIPSKAEMGFWREWADKAPALLRKETQRMAASFDANPPVGNPYKTGGIMLGAVVGAATLTKWVRGKWKLATGGAAVGLLGSGLYMGRKFDEIVCVAKEVMPLFFNELNTYADALEKDQNLRNQLADYLSSHVTATDIQSRGIEEVILGKAIEFGETTPFIDVKTIASHVEQEMRKNNTSCNVR